MKDKTATEVIDDGMPTYLASLVAPLIIRPLLGQSLTAYPGTLAEEEAKDLLDFLKERRFPGPLTEKVIPMLNSRLGLSKKPVLNTGRSNRSNDGRSIFARAKLANTLEDVARRRSRITPRW